MKTYRLKFPNGEVGELRELDDGTWPCPICGSPWERSPPYWPNDGVLGSVHWVSSPSLGDVCDCGVEFGVSEGCGSAAPIGFMREQWAQLRLIWLDRVGWSPEALRQLRDNLGITPEKPTGSPEALRQLRDNLGIIPEKPTG